MMKFLEIPCHQVKIKLEKKTIAVGNIKIPRYMALCDKIKPDVDIFDWWRLNEKNLPHWFCCFEFVALYLTSSAAAERVGSHFHNKFLKAIFRVLKIT